jgi:hypothetical protein
VEVALMKRSGGKTHRYRDMRAIFPLHVDEIARLVAKLEFDAAGCWLWTGARQGAGYGHVGLRGQVWLVHRVMYQICNGPIPPGLVLDHKCGIPSCCNPDHLEPVTIGENNKRAATRKGRNHHLGKRDHCKYGHPLTGSNVRIIHDPRGDFRVCRICAAEAQRRWRLKQERTSAVAPTKSVHAQEAPEPGDPPWPYASGR